MTVLQEALIQLSNQKTSFIYDVFEQEAVVSFDCRALFEIDEFYENKNGSLRVRMKNGIFKVVTTIEELKKFSPFRHE